MKRDKDTEGHSKNKGNQERKIDKQIKIQRPKEIRKQREAVNGERSVYIQGEMERQRDKRTESGWLADEDSPEKCDIIEPSKVGPDCPLLWPSLM